MSTNFILQKIRRELNGLVLFGVNRESQRALAEIRVNGPCGLAIQQNFASVSVWKLGMKDWKLDAHKLSFQRTFRPNMALVLFTYDIPHLPTLLLLGTPFFERKIGKGHFQYAHFVARLFNKNLNLLFIHNANIKARQKQIVNNKIPLFFRSK